MKHIRLLVSVVLTACRPVTSLSEFARNDHLAVIAIPKTGTRSLEIFLQRHTPLRIPQESPGGCIYALAGTDVARQGSEWPRSCAQLQPLYREDETHRRNGDLFLFHANFLEAKTDWRAYKSRFDIESSAKLWTTTILRDPMDRVSSEFHFGLKFELRDEWSEPSAWRAQFWGQLDYSDDQLQELNAIPESFSGTRLEYFAAQPWVAAHNRQTRFLAGVNASVVVTRAILEQAKQNLMTIDVVGKMESMDAYMGQLACALRTTFASSPRVPTDVQQYDAAQHRIKDNSSARKRAYSAAFREAIYRNNWADYELLATATTKIQQQASDIRC
eukprot:m.281383 g.281383  ORF g.281383 m.281383 type:complete len:330 (-) comp19838_c0_seq9:2633-3622(-)